MKTWIFYLAGRYFRTKRKVGRASPQSLQVTGIAIGVMTLITVMGVMNGLQLGFIEDILEISSYHIRIDSVPERDLADVSEKLGDLRGVRAVLPFRDVQTMGRGMFEDFTTLLIRCVPRNAPEMDPGLIEQLGMFRGTFDLEEPGSIVLGYEYALEAGIHPGDTISLVSLASSGRGILRPSMVDFTVTGMFRSGYYDFDRSLAFVSLADYPVLSSADEDEPITLGVKLDDRFRDLRALKVIRDSLDLPDETVVSWREYNKSFFGALKMEKVAMMFLIGLIFLVVGVNIFHSQRRAVYEKQEEIGILKGIGAGPGAIRRVFLFDGFLIGLTGAGIGLILGLLVSFNVNGIFTLVEAVGNAALRLWHSIASSVGGGGAGIDILSPSYFYLIDVPVRILVPEVAGIFCFAVVSTSLAAYIASSRVSRIYPQQVLRYE